MICVHDMFPWIYLKCVFSSKKNDEDAKDALNIKPMCYGLHISTYFANDWFFCCFPSIL